MAKTAQLEEFDEALYKIVDNESTEESEDTSKYLIATVCCCQIRRIVLIFIRVNSLFRLSMPENGSWNLKKSSPSSTLASLRASERKLALMVVTLGVFSESINSKKSNSLC